MAVTVIFICSVHWNISNKGVKTKLEYIVAEKNIWRIKLSNCSLLFRYNNKAENKQ